MTQPFTLSRLRLFSAIEGGSAFWHNEIFEFGSDFVLNKLLDGGYDHVSESSARIRHRLLHTHVDQILHQIADSDATFVTNESKDWPIQLEALAAPPIGLLIRGKRELLVDLDRSISIVGTRNPSTYGTRIAGDFAIGATDHSWSVVSGGAYGIDATAHRAALLNNGSTVAVLAGGFGHNYPAGHADLFSEIAQDGLLITEVMPDVAAEPFRFLTRNRIIAALSRGTVVVEAAYRSGSLRTARDAAEIFRQVMAVPGPINSPTSAGCHRLIAERSAELVTSFSDVLELVNPLGS
ncbi:MAG: DNA-processing protein DprA [Actinomycetes bacterium]